MTKRTSGATPSISLREQAAVEVASALRAQDLGLPVNWEQWDIPPRQGVHDFWLQHGTIQEALEVTTLIDQHATTDAMHWQKRGPGFSTTVPGLSSAWMVMVDPAFNARTLTAGLPGWLRSLERDGIGETGRWDTARMYVHPVTTALAAAGVMIASVVPGPPAGEVALAYLSGMPSRPAGDPNHIAKTLTEALTLPRHVGDAAKLNRSGATDRHLFMWVDPVTRLDISRALGEGIPTVDPIVDPRITEVWLGLPTGDHVDVLRWSSTAGWRYAQVPLQSGSTNHDDNP
ncbi:hypothetical protein [Solwaraspora sp. WMMA2101]|uniref:hypothetical protein n=1 Tax=Solwaraspora sp. WMMA2101 TaxID=3404124 RepID=UPI003B95863F